MNIETYIYMVCTLQDLAAMCYEKWETDIYIYTAKQDQLIEGVVLKTNEWSYNIPLFENMIHANLTNKWLGM